jgi:hypothetical protein
MEFHGLSPCPCFIFDVLFFNAFTAQPILVHTAVVTAVELLGMLLLVPQALALAA